MHNKLKIILISSIILILIVILTITFLNQKEEATTGKTTYMPFPYGDSRKTESQFGDDFIIFNTQPSTTPQENQTNDENSNPEIVAESSKETVPNEEPNEPPTEIIMTEQEIFNTIYPPRYRDLLSFWQDQAVGEGYLTEEERLSFQNEDEIFEFIKKGIGYLENINVLNQEDAERFSSFGMSEWKRINTFEANSLRGTQNTSLETGFGRSLVCSSKTPSNIILGWVKGIFSEKTADAQCFKVGAGIGPVPGVNLWAPCCSCYCGKHACGCLNAVCSCCNAIWDPVTGICGCDI